MTVSATKGEIVLDLCWFSALKAVLQTNIMPPLAPVNKAWIIIWHSWRNKSSLTFKGRHWHNNSFYVGRYYQGIGLRIILSLACHRNLVVDKTQSSTYQRIQFAMFGVQTNGSTIHMIPWWYYVRCVDKNVLCKPSKCTSEHAIWRDVSWSRQNNTTQNNNFSSEA